jgi:SAM-dependent methyltransferase
VNTPQTWHYGLVSEWWAHFNTTGPEIEYFRRRVEAAQPVLDAGCGTGRLLLPWLRAGIDVDGCDVSADMLARCRERAHLEGLEPTLFVQALHELDPPRRYRSIVVCGAFGIGSTRAQDQEALRRLHGSLEPGGTLLLDKEVPYSSARLWSHWTSEGRRELPSPWSREPERKIAADGSEYALWGRTISVDPLDQLVVLGIRAERRRDGELLAAEERELTERKYFRDELVLMLERAGFGAVEVEGAFTGRAPTPEDDFLVFVARR